ncbi:MAG: HAD-IC family P-type ATPase [Desulfuromonadales bacterium]|nr:HAD-IC family P-type ATPase [Desulfuromonadales bacterium]
MNDATSPELSQDDLEQLPWHSFDSSTAFQQLKSSPTGLETAEVESRRLQYGENRLPVKPPPGILQIFVRQFLSPLIYILLAAALISILLAEFSDAGFIAAVVLLNAVLGTYQEWRAEQSAAALQGLMQSMARVRRNGHELELSASELVPGDLVRIISGDRMPADLRLIEARNLSVDESLLTGESQAAQKKTEPLSEAASLGERFNMGYAGTTVIAGRALGLVIATGLQTEVGKIAEAVTESKMTKPPLVIRMERFARQISYGVLGMILLLALIAVAEGTPLVEVFFISVALAVSAIPEGLPVAMTVALAIATSRMAKRNVIVRRLTAVEGLGSCSCIASDKTGTLTINRQTARVIWLSTGEEFSVSGEGHDGEGEVQSGAGQRVGHVDSDGLQRLARAAVICNEAELGRGETGWEHAGDAIDVALLAYAWKLGLDPYAVRSSVEVTDEIPYESAAQFAAVFYVEKGDYKVAVKGAAEQLLPRCRSMLTTAGLVDIDRVQTVAQVERLAGLGYRILAVADANLGREPDLENHAGIETLPPLVLLGLVGFIDPLRPEAKGAVQTCRRAGVRVVMVTGDHPATALSLARELGLATGPEQMLTGAQMERLEPYEWMKQVKKVRVYARVSPLQKVRIVETLGALGHFVAVTGDGVNDAPALRKAHIGVAMGSGSDVARDTASIIVTDDNIASIVAGIEEGRFAYGNIRKVIYLLISTGGAELVMFTLALLAGLPLPLLAVQILWLNLVTNGIQDVALACEAGEPGVMLRPPRPTGEGLFNRIMLQQVLVSGLVMGGIAFSSWVWLLGQGYSVDAARNLVLLLMVLLENFHVFNCRSERLSAFKVPLNRNRLLIGGLIAVQAIHISAMYVPFMQKVLGVVPVTLSEWLILCGLASLLLLVMELYKLWLGRQERGAVGEEFE